MAIVLDGRVPAAGAVLMSVTRMVRLCSAHVVLSFVGPWYPHAGQHLIPWRAPARYEAGRQRADLPRRKKSEYLSGAARPAPHAESLGDRRKLVIHGLHNFRDAPLTLGKKLQNLKACSVSQRPIEPCRAFQIRNAESG